MELASQNVRRQWCQGQTFGAKETTRSAYLNLKLPILAVLDPEHNHGRDQTPGPSRPPSAAKQSPKRASLTDALTGGCDALPHIIESRNAGDMSHTKGC